MSVRALWAETKEVELTDGTKATVKHVGSEDDPLLYAKSNAEFHTALSLCRVEARKKLVELGDDAMEFALGSSWQKRSKVVDGITEPLTLSDAVAAMVDRDPKFIDAYGKIVKTRVVHGVVDGEKVFPALVSRGGSKLVEELASKVQEFNSLSPSTGEG